MVSITD